MSNIPSSLDKNREKEAITPFSVKNQNVELVQHVEASLLTKQYLDRTHLSELEFNILYQLGKYMALTNKMTHMIYKNYNYSYRDISKAFDKLLLKELVEGCRWRRENDTYDSPWVYTLSKAGVYILKKLYPDKFFAILEKEHFENNLSILMGTLVTNNLLIYLQTRKQVYRQIHVRKLFKWEESGKIRQFMPQGFAIMYHPEKQSNYYLMFEPIRMVNKWEDEFMTRMTRYSFFYKNESWKMIFKSKPLTFLIVENEQHAREIMKLVYLTPLVHMFEKNEVFFTTDWAIRDIEELNLHKGLFMVSNDEIKYITLPI